MEIGSASYYKIDGRPLGVQIGQKNANNLAAEIFGGSTSADSIFETNLSASVSASQVNPQDAILNGLQDEIDRTQGFRTNLTPSDKQQLTKFQSGISKLESEAQTRTLTDFEISERADLYVEAYSILGKDYVDVSADEFYQEKAEELDELLATKPRGAQAKRLQTLQNLQADLKESINDRGERTVETLNARYRDVTRAVNTLTAPRPISQLSAAEVRQHDDLVDEINAYVGQELLLSSSKKLKIERLQDTMATIQSGGVNTSA